MHNADSKETEINIWAEDKSRTEFGRKPVACHWRFPCDQMSVAFLEL